MKYDYGYWFSVITSTIVVMIFMLGLVAVGSGAGVVIVGGPSQFALPFG